MLRGMFPRRFHGRAEAIIFFIKHHLQNLFERDRDKLKLKGPHKKKKKNRIFFQRMTSATTKKYTKKPKKDEAQYKC